MHCSLWEFVGYFLHPGVSPESLPPQLIKHGKGGGQRRIWPHRAAPRRQHLLESNLLFAIVVSGSQCEEHTQCQEESRCNLAGVSVEHMNQQQMRPGHRCPSLPKHPATPHHNTPKHNAAQRNTCPCITAHMLLKEELIHQGHCRGVRLERIKDRVFYRVVVNVLSGWSVFCASVLGQHRQQKS